MPRRCHHPGGHWINPTNESSVGRLERERPIRFRRSTGVAILALLITYWLGGILAPRQLEAQQPGVERPKPAVRPQHGIQPDECLLHQDGRCAEREEAKGWEPFQFVRSIPPIPASATR